MSLHPFTIIILNVIIILTVVVIIDCRYHYRMSLSLSTVVIVISTVVIIIVPVVQYLLSGLSFMSMNRKKAYHCPERSVVHSHMTFLSSFFRLKISDGHYRSLEKFARSFFNRLTSYIENCLYF